MERNRPIQEQEYQQALEGYARELNSKANVQEQNDKEADKYNGIISGIAEPVGTALIHPVAKNLFENQVKPALRKALGRGSRAVARTGRQAVADLRDGVNPLDNIASEARQTLSGVRGAVSEVGDNLESALSDSGRALVNNARALGGRRPLSIIQKAKNYFTGSQQPIEDQRATPTTTEETGEAPDSADLSQASLYDTSEPSLISQGASDAFTENPEYSGLIDDIASGRTTLNSALNRAQSLARRTGTTPPRETPQQGVNEQSFRSRVQELNQQEQPTTQDSTNTPTEEEAPATEAPAPAPAPEESLSETLATEATEAEVGGGGPEDIFGDIIAGVLGLGSVIAGAVDPVKPKQYTPTITNPSVQYGI